MKKIISISIGLISFLLLFIFLNSACIKPSKLTLSLEIQMPENDKLTASYLTENDGINKAIATELYLKGSDKIQHLNIDIPLKKPLRAIELLVSSNSNQNGMTIHSAILYVRKHHIDLHRLSGNWFTPNKGINFNNGDIITSEAEGLYNPILTSTKHLNLMLKQLSEPQPQFNLLSAALMALITAITLALSIYYIDLHMEPRRALSYGFIALFFLLLVLPPLAKGIHYEPCKKNYEKRSKAPKPEFSFSEEFPEAYEKYYNDNFGLRNSMVKWLCQIKISLFKCSPKPNLVQFGHNQYLFYNGYDSYCRANLLPSADLRKLHDNLISRQQRLNKSGVTYICGFWPTKHSIYPEFMPFSMASQITSKISLAEQIKMSFNKDSLLFFDVRKEMLKAKDELQLFQKFDTHWNDNGAYVAYRAFCKKTYTTLKLTPYPMDSFKLDYIKCKSGNLTTLLSTDSIIGYTDILPRFKSKYQHFISTDNFCDVLPPSTTVTYNNQCGNRKKVVVFRDSFTTALIKFLSLHFYEVTYIWDRYDDLYVETVKPDIVISCPVEQYIGGI